MHVINVCGLVCFSPKLRPKEFLYAPQNERFKSQKWNNLDTSEEHKRKCQILSKSIYNRFNKIKKNSIRGNEWSNMLLYKDQTLNRWWRALTQLALQVTVLVVFNIFVLAKEVLVDVSPSKQPHVWVVRDGPVCVFSAVECCTLSLGFRRCHNERHAKQPQQLLVSKMKPSLLANKIKNTHTKVDGLCLNLHTSGLCWFLDDTMFCTVIL